jgi:hypothetical protein
MTVPLLVESAASDATTWCCRLSRIIVTNRDFLCLVEPLISALHYTTREWIGKEVFVA